jgi:hypothetical protein
MGPAQAKLRPAVVLADAGRVTAFCAKSRAILMLTRVLWNSRLAVWLRILFGSQAMPGQKNSSPRARNRYSHRLVMLNTVAFQVIVESAIRKVELPEIGECFALG